MSYRATSHMKLAAKCAVHSKPLRLPPLPSPRDLVNLYKLQARKQLSQNFLLDRNLTSKIVKAAGKIRDGDVCEVGPGPGSITRSILERNPGRLLVIEKDQRFLPFLEMLREASLGKLDIVLGDILHFDMSRLFRNDLQNSWHDKCPNIHLVGNLPFSVSTPLIIRWMRDISLRQNAWSYGRVKMTLTFQKEVAERLAAEANGPQRCRLSVMCQNWCHVNHVFTIPGSSFVPPPDVDVGVVTLQPKVEPIINEDFHLVEKVVRHIFMFRQKKCFRSAETLFPKFCREKMSSNLFTLSDVNPETRPFQLTLEEFQRLVLAYKHLVQKDPKLMRYQCGCKDDEFWKSEDGENPHMVNLGLENKLDEKQPS